MKRLAFVLCLAATGCGGQAMPGAAGYQKGESDLGTEIETQASEMERELASLESERKPADEAGGGDQDGAAETPAAPPPVQEEAPNSPPPDAAPSASGTERNEEIEVDEREKKRDGCKTACRALASMKRTEARICELVGESHDKCTWAHERVKDAVARIERAQCSCKE